MIPPTIVPPSDFLWFTIGPATEPSAASERAGWSFQPPAVSSAELPPVLNSDPISFASAESTPRQGATDRFTRRWWSASCLSLSELTSVGTGNPHCSHCPQPWKPRTLQPSHRHPSSRHSSPHFTLHTSLSSLSVASPQRCPTTNQGSKTLLLHHCGPCRAYIRLAPQYSCCVGF